ncbi:MAG: sn-glycerol 3-phosphate transport system substrate-binding protein [Candidatus Aldehydirespiratoraceae bacterium]|jgi:sn-glycerol 3-phosphate transport system substrate-binding protein
MTATRSPRRRVFQCGMSAPKYPTQRKYPTLGVLMVGCLVVAACGSGKSALDAGNDDTILPATAIPVVPVPTGAADPSITANAGDADDEGEPSPPPPTEPSPTTTIAPLAELPPCPVDALATAGGPVEITFWHGLGNELEVALNQTIADYNASQGQVVVELQNQVSYEAIADKYIQSNVDDRPDIVQLPEYVVQSFAQSDTFVPVQACAEASDYDTSAFLPRTLGAYVFEGIQWALPFNVSNPVLYYNRQMFEQAGLDPDDPPVTLEELREVSQQLVDSGVSSTGIALDSGRDSGGGWFFEQWFSRAGALYADNGNGRSAPATKVLFNNELGIELLTYLQEMIDSGLAVTVGDNAGGQDSFLRMIDQDAPAAMTISTSAAISSVIAALGSGIAQGLGPEDIGVGPMPGPSDTPAAQVGGASLWIPAGHDDEVTAAAWDFMQYLTAAQTQSTWADATGYIPIRTDALTLDPIDSRYTNDGRYQVAFDQLLAAADDPSAQVPAIGPQREVRSVTADAIATIYGGGDIAQALADAEAAANALIANYNARN